MMSPRVRSSSERPGSRGLAPGAARLRLLAFAAAAAALAACSVIVDTNADQCSTDADCTAKGSAFAGMVCTAEKVCAKPVNGGQSGSSGSSAEGGAAGSAGSGGAAGQAGGGGTSGCTTNAQCVAANGEYNVCRKADGVCVSLLSMDCTRVVGDYKDDDAFIIGSILPTSGPDQTTGQAVENSIELAINDFQTSSNGLPPAKPNGATRPIVVVSCTDASDGDVGVRAAQHLAQDVRVPAIIGAAFSGITIKIATKVTIPAGVFLISPSATSTAITDLADNGLVWRTSPSDVLQSDALAKLMSQIEAEVRARLAGTKDPIRVAIINKGDSYGKGLADSLTTTLFFNGKAALDNGENFLQFNYGNPDDPQADPPKYADAITKVFAQKPHIVMVFGTNEGVTEIFQKIEEGWDSATAATYKPIYVFSDGGEITELWSYVQAKDSNDSLRKRILGTVPGTNNANYKVFRNLYNSKISDGTSPDVFGTAGGYDSLYMLAYSAAAQGAGPITGATLAAGFKRLVPPGATIKVGSTAIGSAFTALGQGNSIDFDGASGPLNFDVNTGEAPSDIQFWCLPKGSDGKALAGTNSGAAYEAATQSVPQDAFTTIKTTCKF